MPILSTLEKTAYQQSVPSLTVTTLAILTYGIYKTWLYPYYLDPLSRLPGPSPSKIPLVGNMLDLTRKKPMIALYDWAMEYPGSLIRYYWFSRLTLLTSDPVTVGYVLGKGNDNWLKSKETEQQFEQNLGHSLLSMKGHEHTAHRKYLVSGFKHAYLKSMTIAFQRVAHDLIHVWKQRLEQPTASNSSNNSRPEDEDQDHEWIKDGKTYRTINLEPWFFCLTLDSIGEFALGRGFDAIKNPIGPDFENYMIIVESFKVTLLSLLPFSNWIPTRTNRRAWRAVRGFNASMDRLVQERKQELLKENEENEGQFFTQSEETAATSQKKDMLTMLLVDQLEGEGGTDLQIRHDVFTAIFAGHMATHPEVQFRLRREVRQYYNECDGKVTYDALNTLPYLNAVVRESLRLWSPVPLNLRVSLEDDYLPRSNGLEPLFVRGGTNLQLPMFILQRDPKIWGKDSLEFNPERWLLASSKTCPPYMPPHGVCYFPFYHGKRSCIGNKIATLEMKTHIANLVNQFEFVPAPEMLDQDGELPYRWSISLKPNPGVKLGVRLAD
ncbi:hypothetical protein BG004_005955 [Podila humilis]|nr:hypothetical protein BG004_005955 [Podila humilis]